MEEILELLSENSINIEANRFLLGKTYEEISCKINYLKENNLNIINGEKVHEIFWLSYKSIEKRYGISREELFSIYGSKQKVLVY